MNLLNFINTTPYLCDTFYRVARWYIPINLWLKVTRERFRPRRAPVVTAVVAGVTNICNAACVFCNYPRTDLVRGVMSMDIFNRTLDMAEHFGLKHIDLTPVVGDVLVDKHWHDKVVEAKRRGFTIAFTTNGVLLQENLDKLFASGLDRLVVSFPGTKEQKSGPGCSSFSGGIRRKVRSCACTCTCVTPFRRE